MELGQRKRGDLNPSEATSNLQIMVGGCIFFLHNNLYQRKPRQSHLAFLGNKKKKLFLQDSHLTPNPSFPSLPLGVAGWLLFLFFFPCGPLVIPQITFSGTGVPECNDVVINITRTKCLPIILDDAISHQSGSSGRQTTHQ